MVLIERLDACHFLEYSAKHWGQHLAGENAEKQLEPLIMEFLRNEQLRKSAFQALQFRREYASKDLADDIFDAIPADQGTTYRSILGFDAYREEIFRSFRRCICNGFSRMDASALGLL